MNVDIIKLYNSNVSSIPFSLKYSFNEEQLKNSGILKLDNVLIDGFINKDAYSSFTLVAHIKATAIVPCSITLKETEVPIDINIEEQIEENVKNNEKTLDILPIIWENILVEIPTKVVNSTTPAILKGEGWEFVTDMKGKINPELEKLKDLL